MNRVNRRLIFQFVFSARIPFAACALQWMVGRAAPGSLTPTLAASNAPRIFLRMSGRSWISQNA